VLIQYKIIIIIIISSNVTWSCHERAEKLLIWLSTTITVQVVIFAGG